MSDDIRAKRLAKLARPVECSPTSALCEALDKPPRDPPRLDRTANTPLLAGPSDSTSTPVKPPSCVGTSSSPNVVHAALLPPVSLDNELSSFLSSQLGPLFGASVSPDPGLLFLLSLHAELDDSRTVAPTHIEDIFMEILTEKGYPPPINDPISYCFLVYTGALRTRRSLSPKVAFYGAKCDLLNRIGELAVSYALIPFQAPNMFVDNGEDSIDIICRRFTEMAPFFVDMLADSVRQEIAIEFLDGLLPRLSNWASETSVETVLAVFEAIVSVKGAALALTQTSNFFPADKALGLAYQTQTCLGRILSISPLTTPTAYFAPGSWDVGSGQLAALYESAYTEHTVKVERLFFIVDKLMRALAQSRQDMLSWLAGLVNASHLRRGSHADPLTLPSDGFMYNLTLIMIKLSLPFMDFPGYTKISKIDLLYAQGQSMIDISQEPRANSTIQEAVEHAHKVEGNANFISHCFFITSAYVHYGMGGIFLSYDRLKQGISQAEQQIESIKQTLNSPLGSNAAVNNWLRSRVPILTDQINSQHAQRHAIKALFSCARTQDEVFDFLVGTATYICRIIDPAHMYPHHPLKVPLTAILDVALLDDQDYLRSQAPEPWRYMPEFVVEGLVNYAKFSVRFAGCPLMRNEAKLERLIEVFVVLLRCPELLGNPHLKAALVEVLFVGAQPLTNGQPGFAMNVFSFNQIARDNLLYALLDFYVMVEKTGALLQFYDKFNSRYYVSVIIEELWKEPHNRAQLLEYSQNNVAFFVRFVARMLNDTTYLLDETFNELLAVHDFEVETRRRQQGMEANAELGTDEELAKNLAASERKASSYVGLSNKTMELFQLFTKELPRAFVLPEIVDRLAGMLDYNLGVLVGPKCSSLKVADPAKYQFAPKKMLGDLCSVFVNLAGQDEFVAAVARDGRSFNAEYFDKAQRILSQRTQHSMSAIEALMVFCRKAQDQVARDSQQESELGEVPDEFLDPLMYTIMEDPVILPGLKVSIDRLTIKAHLLSDASDPFNRMPLRLEQVVDDDALRQKIVAFKAERRRRRLAEDAEQK